MSTASLNNINLLKFAAKWNGRIYILAVDYNRYVIGKLCTVGSDISKYIA